MLALRGQGNEALDLPAKLADIARPRVGLECGQQIIGKPGRVLP